ncbi:MAG TPA: response regulator [Flavisolibacter sp.]|nr:response regulator [Flavisolibacter sp.]
MAKNGPIILLEHDEDDQLIMKKALQEIGVDNEIKIFDRSEDVIAYLMSTQDKPFIILSDVHLPGIDGIELKRRIIENDLLRKKSIPFVFFTTTARMEEVDNAYKMMVQGYFEKEDHMKNMKASLRLIIDYWMLCKHPNVG